MSLKLAAHWAGGHGQNRSVHVLEFDAKRLRHSRRRQFLLKVRATNWRREQGAAAGGSDSVAITSTESHTPARLRVSRSWDTFDKSHHILSTPSERQSFNTCKHKRPDVKSGVIHVQKFSSPVLFVYKTGECTSTQPPAGQTCSQKLFRFVKWGRCLPGFILQRSCMI